jgi:uncharacterized protein YidB (DUF937 family)
VASQALPPPDRVPQPVLISARLAPEPARRALLVLLKGVLSGGAAGTALSGGLNDLLKQFQQNGQGDVANSWVGTVPNQAIAPKDLANALGADRINALMAYSGMAREDMLAGLSKHLPDVVDKLTPDGRLPTEEEAARLV